MKRLFLAIPIPDELKSEIKKHIDSLSLPLNWIPESNWHLTLNFLGNMEEAAMDTLIQKVKAVTENTLPFALEANSLLVKSGKFQNMIWVGFKNSSEFEKLTINIGRTIGMDTPRKPLPHINLIRSKNKIKSESLPAFFKIPLILEVKHIELWESKLSAQGSTYWSLKRFPFKINPMG